MFGTIFFLNFVTFSTFVAISAWYQKLFWRRLYPTLPGPDHRPNQISHPRFLLHLSI